MIVDDPAESSITVGNEIDKGFLVRRYIITDKRVRVLAQYPAIIESRHEQYLIIGYGADHQPIVYASYRIYAQVLKGESFCDDSILDIVGDIEAFPGRRNIECFWAEALVQTEQLLLGIWVCISMCIGRQVIAVYSVVYRAGLDDQLIALSCAEVIAYGCGVVEILVFTERIFFECWCSVLNVERGEGSSLFRLERNIQLIGCKRDDLEFRRSNDISRYNRS